MSDEALRDLLADARGPLCEIESSLHRVSALVAAMCDGRPEYLGAQVTKLTQCCTRVERFVGHGDNEDPWDEIDRRRAIVAALDMIVCRAEAGPMAVDGDHSWLRRTTDALRDRTREVREAATVGECPCC